MLCRSKLFETDTSRSSRSILLEARWNMSPLLLYWACAISSIHLQVTILLSIAIVRKSEFRPKLKLADTFLWDFKIKYFTLVALNNFDEHFNFRRYSLQLFNVVKTRKNSIMQEICMFFVEFQIDQWFLPRENRSQMIIDSAKSNKTVALNIY